MNNFIELLKDPYNLNKWIPVLDSHKITKNSPLEHINNVRVIYFEFLKNFPYLVNYYIKFVEIEYELNNFDKCYEIYELGFKYLSYSIEFWISFLKFKIINTAITDITVVDLLDNFETARSFIGHHYFSGDFYKLYLDFLRTYESLGLEGKYSHLLKYVIELPIHDYQFFFKQFPPQDKKTIVDAYITTQYKSFKKYEFEKKLTNYYDVKYISNQELKTWEKYLNFLELNYPIDVVIQTYERAVITTAAYSLIWNKYIDYLVSLKRFRAAEEIGKRSRQITRLVDIERYWDRELLVSALNLSKDTKKTTMKELVAEEGITQQHEDQDWNDFNEKLSTYI